MNGDDKQIVAWAYVLTLLVLGIAGDNSEFVKFQNVQYYNAINNNLKEEYQSITVSQGGIRFGL